MDSSLNIIWLLLFSGLIIVAQAGFALCEVGFTRSVNDGIVSTRRIVCLAVSVLVFFLAGAKIMYPDIDCAAIFTGSAVSGTFSSDAGYVLFTALVCSLSVAVVAGATAERMKLSSAVFYSAVISLIIFPLAGRWISGGFLASLGFRDFAGSSLIHILGGASALVCSLFLGPRKGKYDEKGVSCAIPGRNITLGGLGIFLIWFGWLGVIGGFSSGYIEAADYSGLALIFVNAFIAPAAAVLATLLYSRIRYKKTDTSMVMNAALAGLAGISAGCDGFSPVGALITGIICGFAMPALIELVDRVFHIDDPTGAVSVHLGCGIIGALLTGLLHTEAGLFYGGGISLLGVQALGIIIVVLLSCAVLSLLMFILKMTIGIRISSEEESRLLSVHPAGQIPVPSSASGDDDVIDDSEILIAHETFAASDIKITRVDIVLNQNKFDELKKAMARIGVTGMTVTNVYGCGTQKGRSDVYRGIEYEMNLLPKLKVEIVISKVPVSEVVKAARDALYTGKIGDGKIFVYDVENVIRVRTGEDGYDALQSDNPPAAPEK